MNLFGSGNVSTALLKQYLFLGIGKQKPQSGYAQKNVSLPRPETPMIDKVRKGQVLTAEEQKTMQYEMKKLHNYRVLSVNA